LGIAAVVVLAVVLTVIASRRSSDAVPASDATTEDTAGSFAPLHLTSLDGEQIALPAGRPGMVMFSTSLCVTCFVSARDMSEYEITVLGTVLVYDAAGKIVARIVEPGPGDLRSAFHRAGAA
jgi:hypothetical protein